MTTTEVKTKGRILVVDDIPDTVELLKDWLTSHQYDTLGERVTSMTLWVLPVESRLLKLRLRVSQT